MWNRLVNTCKKNMVQLLVLLAIALTLLGYSVQKEGYFLDEILSYQLSCAEFNPFILANQPVGRLAKFVNEELRGETVGETFSNLVETARDVLENKGNSKLLQYRADVYAEPVWITGQQFKDYVTVSKADDFNYLSVYFNARADIHPPLYYMALHTAASIVKGSMSPMIGCGLNILLILCTCICLMKLCVFLEKQELLPAGYGKWVGVCAAVLYGISSGAIASALFTRMYALMALFSVLAFCLHVKKWYGQGFATKRLPLIAVVTGGFLTQYFFLFFYLPLAAVTAFSLVVKKRFKEFWNYVVSMILAAGLGVGIFPFCFSDVFSSAFGNEITSVLGGGFGEYGEALGRFVALWVERYYGNLLYGLIVTFGLALAAVLVLVKGKKEQEPGRRGRVVPFWLFLAFSVVGYVCLTAKASLFIHSRYMMPVFPFGALLLAMMLMVIMRGIRKEPAHFMLVPAVVLALVSVLLYDGEFLYKGYEKQIEIAKEYSDLPCVSVYAWDGLYENVREYMHYEKTLLVYPWEFAGRQNPEELAELDEVILIRKITVSEEDVLNTAASYGWELQEVLMTSEESAYGDTIYLYKAGNDKHAE